MTLRYWFPDRKETCVGQTPLRAVKNRLAGESPCPTKTQALAHQSGTLSSVGMGLRPAKFHEKLHGAQGILRCARWFFDPVDPGELSDSFQRLLTRAARIGALPESGR